MRNITRALFTAYVANVALLNEVAAATDKFSVSPAVQQRLEQRLQVSIHAPVWGATTSNG